MSLKIPVTPPGIDLGTVRIVVQRLSHYANPGPVSQEELEDMCICVTAGVLHHVSKHT
jgi:hypothetical protein